MGRNIYQKPRLKQDKGGGIIPTAEGARIVLTSSKQRGGKTPPRRLLCRPWLAYKHAGNPLLVRELNHKKFDR